MAVPAEATSSSDLYTVQPYTPDVEAFVLSSWLKSHRDAALWAQCVTNAVYFGQRHPLATSILARSRCLVAYDAIPQPIGTIVWEPETQAGPALHWCYVLLAFRGHGIGTALLNATGLPRDLEGVHITHATKSWFRRKGKRPGTRALEDRFPKAINNPDLPWTLELAHAASK